MNSHKPIWHYCHRIYPYEQNQTKSNATKKTTEKYNNNKQEDSFKVLLSAINFLTFSLNFTTSIHASSVDCIFSQKNNILVENHRYSG